VYCCRRVIKAKQHFQLQQRAFYQHIQATLLSLGVVLFLSILSRGVLILSSVCCFAVLLNRVLRDELRQDSLFKCQRLRHYANGQRQFTLEEEDHKNIRRILQYKKGHAI
jgi:hypothetical protein